MLIVAIPKSASTSLIQTLGELHHLPNVNVSVRSGLVARCPVAPEYAQLAKFHPREVVEVDARVVEAVRSPDSIAKFHFPPTPNNQARLRDVRKLILLRDAVEIVAAYRRGDATGAFRLKSHEFCYCLSEEGWSERARKLGLIDELRAFAAGWRAHDGDKLVVEASELVARPAAVLARVERYFELPLSGADTLRQEKYSRAPSLPQRSAAQIVLARWPLILKRIASDLRKLAVGAPL